MAEHKFNPNEHLMQIGYKDKAKDYLPVQWRLVWFREQCPQGTIDTEELEVDLDRETEAETQKWNNETRKMETIIKRARGYARYRAVVTDGKGGRATGTKSETAASFPDFIEKAETGATGRALAALGYGTQFCGDEFDEEHRIADAPVDRSQRQQSQTNGSRAQSQKPAQNNGQQQPTEPDGAGPITEQQQSSIAKMYQHLGKEAPTEQPANYQAAKELIAQLSQEYRNARAAAKK